MPYWIESTLAATPAFAWIFFGVGVPWSLAILPRADWQKRVLVVTLGLALGSILLTAWMFILGTLGTLRFDFILAGTVILAIIGTFFAWRKRNLPFESLQPRPLAFDEKLLIGLIIVAVIIRWFGIAYWPFTAYDALWVYGYEGRLYTLTGAIPPQIDYYPQFLPLQYTYAQLALGRIDDHAARAGLIFLHLGSILAVYLLGSTLTPNPSTAKNAALRPMKREGLKSSYNRRVGIFAAALWALYPHVAQWSRFGDLEIPLTFLITLTAAFFLMAWFGERHQRRYAIIAGLIYGAALWTKPTAGGLVWGVLLLLIVELMRLRFDWRTWLPRFQVALITAIAAAPLGGLWYIRNILLGHNPIDLPPSFWQTLAARSGVEFGWLILALLILLAYLYFGQKQHPNRIGGIVGLGFVLAGLFPSIITPRRMTILEYALLAVGLMVLAMTLVRYARKNGSERLNDDLWKVGAAFLIAVPYFITWFWSYSYHYRLSFAIVPLLILPIALILARWLSAERVKGWTASRRGLYAAGLIALSLPGVVLALHDENEGWDWLWTDKLPNDVSRYQSGNAALMNVVEGLQAYLDERDAPLVVVAPGVKQLPFFFPLEDIRTDEVPTRFNELDGVVYFIESSPEGRGEYESIPLAENQVLSGLDRLDVMRPAWGKDDGILRYQVYELYLAERFVSPEIHVPPSGDAIFGGFARFLGHDVSGAEFWLDRKLFMHLYWEVLEPAPEDYTIYIHLRDADDNVQAAWDAPVARSEDGQRYYTTLVWEPGEFITDERILRLEQAVPLGAGYSIVIGMYNAVTGERVSLTIDNEPAGDGYQLGERISVVPVPDGE